ncbi:hypothetical protein ACJJTC_005523 [Scirpophaga incertulas]
MADYTRTDVTARICILNNQKIHSIITFSKYDKLAIIGGKQLRIVLFSEIGDDIEENFGIKMLDLIECVDWIHCAAWIDHATLAILSAHNTVQIWNILKQEILNEYLNCQNSILYCGLLQPLADGLLVFAGTVYSEVIVHMPTDKAVLQCLKGHRGVIFSISADIHRGIIVTTSDDRSVRIWQVAAHSCNKQLSPNISEYWRNVSITCRHEVYGHSARVMRSSIADECIISGGEDSTICVWDLDGKLLQKRQCHQNGSIWCLDVDQYYLVSGGADGAVILNTIINSDQKKVFQIDTTPRKINFTARRNLIILDDTNLIYVTHEGKIKTIHELKHESTYKLLSLSSCKQLAAVVDMTGKFDVFAENCKYEPRLSHLIDTKLNIGKIQSMHWAGNRHVIFCSEGGIIHVLSSNNSNIDKTTNFILPQCKERWLTAVAMDPISKILVVGDRCGNIHIYLEGHKTPSKTFNKVHGRYGPTSLTLRDNSLITTGRDGAIKCFFLNKTHISLSKLMFKREYDFRWVEKFLDKNNNIVCGFQERTFVVYDVNRFTKIYEIPCGGGHRSWDVFSFVEINGGNHDKFIDFVYIKNNEIHSCLIKLDSNYVVNSSLPKEINTMKCFDTIDETKIYYITGGEDTTLRVSSLNRRTHEFEDMYVFKHLSNIRTVKTISYKDGIFVVAAGGRAQICIRHVDIVEKDDHMELIPYELVDYLIKGRDKQRKNNLSWKNSTVDFDPETRIMDIELLPVQKDNIAIFAGCSDAYLRVFSYSDGILSLMKELLYHETCILKTVSFELVSEHYLVTCTTRGDVALWNITKPFSKELSPFFRMRTNKAGINSVDVKVVSDTEIFIATGGDDNAVHLNLISISNDEGSTCVKSQWSTDIFHCSQITGLRFADEYLVSTSIDQRITFYRWCLEENGIVCEFIAQEWSDIADIQGLEIQKCDENCITFSIYGKGLELKSFNKRRS